MNGNGKFGTGDFMNFMLHVKHLHTDIEAALFPFLWATPTPPLATKPKFCLSLRRWFTSGPLNIFLWPIFCSRLEMRNSETMKH